MAAQFRVVFRAAQVPGQELFFPRQQRFVNKPDQAVQVHNVLFDGGASEQQFERLPSNPFEGFGLLVAFLIDPGQGIGFLKDGQIPVDHLGGILVVGRKVVGGDHKGVLDKGIRSVRTGVLPPLIPICQYHIRDGIESLQHFRPLL